MIPDPEMEKLIRSYLLGLLPEEDWQKIEEQVLGDDDFIDSFSLIEEELIDDYLLDTLTKGERECFEIYYLSTPDRKRKMEFARQLMSYAFSRQIEVAEKPARESGLIGFKQILFLPWWKAAAWSTVLLISSFLTWHFYPKNSQLNQALTALDRAYHLRRPLAARITGFEYAEFKYSVERGGEPGDQELEIDYLALDQARNILLRGENSDPAMTHARGKYYLTQKEFEKAIDQFKKALSSAPNNAQLHSDLGAAYLGRIERDRFNPNGRKSEDVEQCLKNLNRALELDPKLLEALYNRALLYQGERLRREAREDWEKYRQLDPKSPWGDEAAENLKLIESELKKVSRREDELYREYIRSVQLKNDDKSLEIFGLTYSFNGNQIVEKLIDGYLEAKLSGRPAEASEKLGLLSHIARLSESKTGDRFAAELANYYRRANPKRLELSKAGRELMREAYQLYRKAKNDPAIEKYERAREMFLAANDQGEAYFAEAWIGHCHHQRSDVANNLKIFSRLAPIFARKKYLWMEANAACGLANGHNSSGQFSQAINTALRCGELSERVGDQLGLIRSLYIRGGLYRTLGKHQDALRIADRGLDRADAYSAEIRYAIAFYQISSLTLSSLSLFESARAYQLEAVKMAEESKSPRLLARSNIHLGRIYGSWKKYEEAISSIQQGIATGRELANDETGLEFVHYGLLDLGNVYREAGRFDQALNAFDEVIDYYHKSGRQIFLYAGSKGRLLTLIAQNNDAAARLELNRVINLYEKYRDSIQEESNRNRFFDQEQSIYDVAIDFAYTRLGNSREALSYSELCRARTLLDATKGGYQAMTGPEAPDLKIETDAQPESVESIRSQIPERIQLLEYAVVENKLFIWMITRSGIKSVEVGISETDLNARVNEYLNKISRTPGRDDREWQERSAELYDILIRPIEGLLDRQKQLCIIPDKVLYRLPFSTLMSRDSGKVLAEDFRLLHAPSASIFLHSTENARRKSVVDLNNEKLFAVGNPAYLESDFPQLPRLPSAEREARAIAGYYKSTSPMVLINSEARKNIVIREIVRADVVHLALHYQSDPWSPMLSRMPMASTVSGDPQRALHMYELYQLKSLQPRLVVLSACRTMAEEYLGGEGAIGVSRPFEAAGIPLIVASLWPVDTVATSDLMIAFHRARKELRLSTVDALRDAQMGLFNRNDKYRHPYYWAAFITVGGFSENF